MWYFIMEKQSIRYNLENGEELYRDVHKIEIVYQANKITLDMPGWYPIDNNEGIFDKEDMKVYSKVINNLKEQCKFQ